MRYRWSPIRKRDGTSLGGAVVALLAVFALLIAACGGGGESPTADDTVDDGTEQATSGGEDDQAGSDEGPVVIGVVGPLTQVAVWGGEYLEKGVRLAADQLNEQGGLGGREIEVVVEDGQCDPAVTTSAMERLMREDPVATIGGFCSSATLAALEVSDREQVPHFAVSEAAVAITDGTYDYSVRINPHAEQQAQVMAEYLTTEEGAERVFTVYEETDAGNAERDALSAALEEAGVEFESVGVERELSDFGGIVNRASAFEPDYVTLHMTDGQLIRFVQEATSQGLEAPAATFLWASPNLFDEAGDRMDGFLYLQMFLPGAAQTDQQQSFLDAYRSEYDEEPWWLSATAYDAVNVLNAAVGECDCYEGEELIGSLRGLQDFSGVTGTYSIDEDGQASFSLDRFLLARWNAEESSAEVVFGGGS